MEAKKLQDQKPYHKIVSMLLGSDCNLKWLCYSRLKKSFPYKTLLVHKKESVLKYSNDRYIFLLSYLDKNFERLMNNYFIYDLDKTVLLLKPYFVFYMYSV